MVRRKRAKRVFISRPSVGINPGWMGAHPAAQPSGNWTVKNMWFIRKTRGGRG